MIKSNSINQISIFFLVLIKTIQKIKNKKRVVCSSRSIKIWIYELVDGFAKNLLNKLNAFLHQTHQAPKSTQTQSAHVLHLVNKGRFLKGRIPY